jgi:molecular chaperone DnaJ
VQQSVQTSDRDYYEVLGVERDADVEAIKKAYRARARELHPDVSPDPAADARFTELAEAYGVLSKSSSRLLYDRFGYRGRGNGWFGPAAGGGVDATPFDFWSAPRRRRPTPPVFEIVIDALEAARGTSRTIAYPVTEICLDCDGTGAGPGSSSTTCPDCGGTGRTKERTSLPDALLLRIDECPTCAGNGRLHSVACSHCGGAGETSEEREVRVRVPPGTVDRDPFRFDAGGDIGFVTVRVRAPRDSRVARYVASLLLVAALVFLVLLLTR